MINTWPGWKCVELLGEGSFGKVFRICREDFGRTYEAALKVITIPGSKSEIESAYAEGMDEKSITNYFYSFVEDIVAEFALMSQIKGNTNIVSYEDHMVVQHEDGIGWDILIRMELLTPLLSYMKQHPMEEEDVIRLGIDMARALKLCRKKGIIHRDIKPENIFVNEDGDFKLGDFGVARVAEKTVSVMSKKGTYSYMAPEVYKGEVYGYSADLYSLGLVLYRLLNDNRMPFMPPAPQPIKYSDRENAMNARMMNQPMSAPIHGSRALQAIVLKACAYDPADRFAEAEEMERALIRLETVETDEPKHEDEEEDEFDKTISTFGGKQPKKNREVQPIEEEVEIPCQFPEDDEDEFEKTVSAFDNRRSNQSSKAEDERAQAERAKEEAKRIKEEQAKADLERIKAEKARAKAEEERAKAESAQAERERRKAELAKKVEENEKNRKASGKKPKSKGRKIAVALAVSVLVAIPLPPVGIGLAAIWLTVILVQK